MAKISLDTTGLHGCAITGCRASRLYRHHKGCDNMIGKHVPEVAANYSKFLDSVRVCDRHHMTIHYMYLPILNSWSDFSPEGALRLRAKLITFCDRIINGSIKLQKPTKGFRKSWLTRRRAWLKALRKSRST